MQSPFFMHLRIFLLKNNSCDNAVWNHVISQEDLNSIQRNVSHVVRCKLCYSVTVLLRSKWSLCWSGNLIALKGFHSYTTVFTRVKLWALSWGHGIQLSTPLPISMRYNWVLTYYLGLFHSCFWLKFHMFFISAHVYCMSDPSNPLMVVGKECRLQSPHYTVFLSSPLPVKCQDSSQISPICS